MMNKLVDKLDDIADKIVGVGIPILVILFTITLTIATAFAIYKLFT